MFLMLPQLSSTPGCCQGCSSPCPSLSVRVVLSLENLSLFPGSTSARVGLGSARWCGWSHSMEEWAGASSRGSPGPSLHSGCPSAASTRAPHQAGIRSWPPRHHQAPHPVWPHPLYPPPAIAVAPVQAGTQQVGLPSSDISLQTERK